MGQEIGGEHLAFVRMAGNLEVDACLFSHIEIKGRVPQKDARLGRVYLELIEDGSVLNAVARIQIIDTEELDTLDVHLLIIQDSDADIPDGFQEGRIISEFFMVAGNEIFAHGRGQPGQGTDQAVRLETYAVEDVAAEKDEVRMEILDLGSDFVGESGPMDIAEVEIACEDSRLALPGRRQVGQPDGDAGDPDGGGVYETIGAQGEGQDEQRARHVSDIHPQMETVDQPEAQAREDRSQEQEVKDAHPRDRDGIEPAHVWIAETQGQQSAKDEAESQEKEENPESGGDVYRKEKEEAVIKKKMSQENKDLDEADAY